MTYRNERGTLVFDLISIKNHIVHAINATIDSIRINLLRNHRFPIPKINRTLSHAIFIFLWIYVGLVFSSPILIILVWIPNIMLFALNIVHHEYDNAVLFGRIVDWIGVVGGTLGLVWFIVRIYLLP